MASEEKKEQKQKQEIAKNPSRDDVHEQRDAEQPNTSVVPATPSTSKPRPPTQTQSDRERADWEGMGQPQSRPGE